MAVHTSLTVADWHRLNRLLERGLELEGAARTPWLESLGDEDRHLRAVLVDLLSQSEAADFAGATHPPTGVARLASQALAAMRREQPGERIGPWQLERLIAEGGMGAVWIAQRVDGVMKRIAALKLPRAEWVDQGLSERIARERAILARLQHPAIAVLYDAGVSDGGRPYLALEYVDGVPIDAYCTGRKLEDVLRLFVQVVRAVAYAHAQLVIHRDLKPANVLVTAEGLPKLLDFGISKLIEGEAPTVDETALTRLAGRPLTLAYAAPEQVLGLPITVAADVYALGVMLFELVTAERLYRASDQRALEAEILRGDLRKPSDTAHDKQRAKALKGDLDAVILKALKREPAERYQSAAALADDLERYLEGQPVQAQPDSRAYRLRKFVTRNALPVAAGSAVLLALGIGLGVALWQANEARDQAARATALNTFVLSLIRQADPNASAQTKAADLAMLATIEERIDKEFKGSPDQVLQLRLTIGDAYRNRGESAAAQRVYQRALDAAAPRLAADNLQLLTARVRAADYNLIVSSAASSSLDGAIEILRTKGAAGADLLIDGLLIRHELGFFFGVPAFVPVAQRYDVLNEALEVARRFFGEGSRQELRVVQPYADLIEAFGKREDRVQLLETSLAHARARSDGVMSSPEYRDVNFRHMMGLCESERSAEVLPALWEMVAAERAAHGERSLQLERANDALGGCLAEAGDPTAEWFKYDGYAIAAARERPPSTHLMRRAESAYDLAMSQRNWDEAERYYQSAIQNSKAIVDPALRERLMHPLSMNRVCLLAQRGDLTEAEQFAAPIAAKLNEEFARLRRPTPGQDAFWSCLSFAQRQDGRFAEAIRTVQTIIDRCKHGGAPVYCYARPLRERALAELDAGLNAEALVSMQERLKLPRKLDNDPNAALAYGRALLANGRPQEALEPLRMAYGSWLSSMQPRGFFAAEVLYWFGQAWIANGEVKRGRWMVADARRTLADSPLKGHQALARRPAP